MGPAKYQERSELEGRRPPRTGGATATSLKDGLMSATFSSEMWTWDRPFL